MPYSTDPFKYFSGELIQDLYNAAVAVEFNENEALRTLSGGINPHLRGQLPTGGGNANFNLKTTLDKLNSIEKLVGGEIPFLLWLRNAAALSTGRPEGEVFRRALSELSASSSGESDVGDVSSLPELEPVVAERVVFYNDMVPFGFLRRGHEAGLAVARLEVPRHDDGQPRMVAGNPDLALGSGWLRFRRRSF